MPRPEQLRICPVCQEAPARVYRPGQRPWCGVCAHQLAVARDLALRIAKVKR